MDTIRPEIEAGDGPGSSSATGPIGRPASPRSASSGTGCAAPGRMLGSLEPARFRAALPSVLRTLAGISSVAMTDTGGFGWFDPAGHGPDASWKVHLGRVAEVEPGMFYGNWHGLFETTFLERDRYDAYFARMTELPDSISVPRLLVHGGFGYGNVLVEDDTVTVVLDWQDARFGDPLFDLAYMDFWPSGLDLTELFRPYCRDSAIRSVSQPTPSRSGPVCPNAGAVSHSSTSKPQPARRSRVSSFLK